MKVFDTITNKKLARIDKKIKKCPSETSAALLRIQRLFIIMQFTIKEWKNEEKEI
jgi:hypothetical protein